MLKFIWIGLATIALTACEDIAVQFTPKKQPIYSHTRLAAKAEQEFWTTLHQGNYQNIPQTERLLLAAYLENPNDPKLAAHLGFLHIWKLAERAREKNIPPTIVNEAILARYYFSSAVELNPADARYVGFYGVSQLVTGKIFHDEREQTRGYFTLKHAIRMWPEFNYFTAGYPMSILSANSKQFKEGLNWQWKTMDLCAGEKINHVNPNFQPYMKNETHTGPKRACWNSWIAPYNFEGFFLNMGDMLVKSGDWQTAIKIYQNAKLDSHYSVWPYRNLLENRIKHAKENVKNFQRDNLTTQEPILFNSRHNCTICHQSQAP